MDHWPECKTQNSKFLEENTGNLDDLGFGNEFLDTTHWKHDLWKKRFRSTNHANFYHSDLPCFYIFKWCILIIFLIFSFSYIVNFFFFNIQSWKWRWLLYVSLLVVWTTITKYHWLVGLHNRSLFSQSSRDREVQEQVISQCGSKLPLLVRALILVC